MKDTGVMRRIDELGRIVIPKEIRRTYRIKEGDVLEIFTENGSIVMKKASQIESYKSNAEQMGSSLYRTVNKSVLISDREKIIFVKGDQGRDYIGKSISSHLDGVLRDCKVETACDEPVAITRDGDKERAVIYPLIKGGECLGLIIVLMQIGDQPDKDLFAVMQYATCMFEGIV